MQPISFARRESGVGLLDNPTWSALTSRQSHFAEVCGEARRFPPEVTLLGAFSSPSPHAYESLAQLQSPGQATALFLADRNSLPAGWTIYDGSPLLQMVRDDCPLASSASEWIELSEADVPEMMALAALTKPGPFGPRTRELGTYIGIRREGKLVAMAGERLRVAGYSEISAVCTHPESAGQGYAARLMTVLMEMILSRGELPFLHVRSTNQRAIELYRRFGFVDRFVFQFVAVGKPAGQTRSAS